MISEWITGGGNQALSGSQSGVVDDLFLEPKTSVEMYDLVNVDGQKGNDSATEISSGGASVPHSGQTMLDSNNIVKDDITDNTDADYTIPMQEGGVVIVGDSLSTFSTELIGTMARTAEGTCKYKDSDGVVQTRTVQLPTTGGWYIGYNSECDEDYYNISAITTDLASEEYSIIYNDAAIWQNGTTPYILDMKFTYVGSYENQGTVGFYEPATELEIDNVTLSNYDYRASMEFGMDKPEMTMLAGQRVLDVSFTISDTEEYGYADAGKTPEEIAGHDVPVNLVFTDTETAVSIILAKDDLYGITIPYCDVKYNTDLTVDTANTDPKCLDTTTYDEDGHTNDFGYIIGNSNYNYLTNRRGYTNSGGWVPTEPDALLTQYIIDQRLKAFKVNDGLNDYVGVMDSWRANGTGGNQTATNYQISTNDSSFRLYNVEQFQWFYNQSMSYGYGNGQYTGFTSIEEPIVSMAKVQEDTGIDGKGVNDDIVAPGEIVHYHLYAINSGFDGEAGYRFYDDVTNLLEYTGVINNIGVKKITGANFSPFLAEYTQYMNDPTLGDIPACGSTEAIYTCEDVTAITNSSSGGVVDITLNEALPTQTAYELSFDVVVGADYNGQIDKKITNTGYLTEPGCTITSGIPSSSCSANESVTIEYGSIALKIAKAVNDTVDSSYTPSEGISANGDTYASSEEWLNYTITITNKADDGALNVAQDVQIIDDLTLDTNLSKIDPATIVVTSSIGGALVAPVDYTDASTVRKLDITLPAIEVDEAITITFKAQAL